MQGFSCNPQAEFLHFPATQEAIDAYREHYHENKIPDKYFKHGKYAVLLKDISYTAEDGRKYTAKRGLITDGLSVPRVFWARFGAPWRSRYLPAGLIHDSLCGQSEDVARIDCLEEAQTLRKKADKLFKKMLVFLKASWYKARMMYRAVRLGSISLRFVKKTLSDT